MCLNSKGSPATSRGINFIRRKCILRLLQLINIYLKQDRFEAKALDFGAFKLPLYDTAQLNVT